MKRIHKNHVLGAAAAAVVVSAASGASAQVAVFADFNGDGRDDYALGNQTTSVSGVANAGSVAIYIATSAGLPTTPTQRISEETLGASLQSAAGFGAALAAGDFNGDGYADLAVGALGRDGSNATQNNLGAVRIVFGRAGVAGLRTTGSQSTLGFRAGAQANDMFGCSLVAGDFNNDQISDLAVGAYGHDVSGKKDAGQIALYLGARNTGVNFSRELAFNQDTANVEGVAEADDLFGSVLAAGDFNVDGRDDLVVGIPSESIGTDKWAGAVQVFYGPASAVDLENDQIITQDGSIPGVSEPRDMFGYSLAVGDFNGDLVADLAIGIPYETLDDATVDAVSGAGAVAIVYGTLGSRLLDSKSRLLTEGNSGVASTPFPDNNFGAGLAAGDVDGDGRDDLVASAPGMDVNRAASLGGVHTVFGPLQTGTVADRLHYFGAPGIVSQPARAAQLGVALAVGYVDRADDAASGDGGEGGDGGQEADGGDGGEGGVSARAAEVAAAYLLGSEKWGGTLVIAGGARDEVPTSSNLAP